MTQEEKAKAYDDAIKRAKRMFSEKELNYLFPELAESDDEKIISAIRKAIEAKVENLGNGVTRTACLAWLEKQGNTNIFDVPKISIKNAVEVTSRMQYIDDDIKPIAEFIMDYANWDLHKDEWNQPTLTVPLFRVLDALIQKGKPYCVCNQNIEKQGEHNPADKAEPKFKVSDWCIDNEDGTIFQIVKVLDNTYNYRTNEGKEYSCTHYSLELGARPWTISDVKDGDVLYDGNAACIFRKTMEDDDDDDICIDTYCGINIDNEFKVNDEDEYWCLSENCSPATKEQCDTLMKAMADAGYTFDFEKKELKEIENEEYDGEDYGIDSLWHAKNILEKTLGKVDGYQTDDGILDHKCAISAVNKLCKEDAKITNRWNPSDEHIHWLKWVINRMPDTEKANEAEVVLKDLLEQLEEL